MNFEVTKRILEKFKSYIDVKKATVDSYTDDFRDKEYKIDRITLDEETNLWFEVTNREIIIFCLDSHQHFDNYATDENDDTYIDHAIEFLEDLFTLPIKLVEKWKGQKVVNEKYYFIKDDEDHCFENISPLLLFFNPFAKKIYRTSMWKYDSNTNRLVNVE